MIDLIVQRQRVSGIILTIKVSSLKYSPLITIIQDANILKMRKLNVTFICHFWLTSAAEVPPPNCFVNSATSEPRCRLGKVRAARQHSAR